MGDKQEDNVKVKGFKTILLNNHSNLSLIVCTAFLAVAGVANLIIRYTTGVIESRYIIVQIVFLLAGAMACLFIQNVDFQYERLLEKKWLPGLTMVIILFLIFLRYQFPWVNGTYYWIGAELIHISIGLIAFTLYGTGAYALLIQKREQLWKYIFFLLIPVAYVLHRCNDYFSVYGFHFILGW